MGKHGDEIKFRIANKILIRNGFVQTTRKGSHYKYERNNKHLIISANDVNRMMWQRLCKEFEIDVNK